MDKENRPLLNSNMSKHAEVEGERRGILEEYQRKLEQQKAQLAQRKRELEYSELKLKELRQRAADPGESNLRELKEKKARLVQQ